MSHEAFGAALAAAPQAERGRLFLRLIDGVIESIGEDAAIEMIRSAFREFVVPIDIPYTPEWVEKRVEAVIDANIGTIVKRIHAAVHQEG